MSCSSAESVLNLFRWSATSLSSQQGSSSNKIELAVAHIGLHMDINVLL